MGVTARERLFAASNIRQVWKDAWQRIKHSTPGVDGITPKQFNDDITARIRFIRSEIKEGYSFAPLRGVRAPKKDPTKFRIICVPTIQDRLVQRVLLQALEQRATVLGIANDVSFGFVKDTETMKRGTSGARAAAVKHRQVKPWAFKTDITAFFDRIDRPALIEDLRRTFKLSSLHPLVEGAIRCEVDDHDPRVRRVLHDNEIRRGVGLRQGMPLSPLLSNFVLKSFDAAFAKAGFDMVRYADDLVVLCSSRTECEDVEAFVRDQLAALGHSVSEKKTETRSPDEPIEFLGMELGLKPGGSKYILTISEAQMRAVKASFTNYHDVDFALKDDLTLPKLLHRLANMKSGYRAAYNIAHNFTEFSASLDDWSNNCIRSVYGSIFGGDKIAKLSPKRKQFLQIPD